MLGACGVVWLSIVYAEPGATSVDASAPPDEANPYVAFLPSDATPDLRRWSTFMRRRALDRQQFATPVRGTSIIEQEPNDSLASALRLDGIGTGDGESRTAEITGSFSPTPPTTTIGPFAEDDGSIPLANATQLVAGGSVTVSGVIGDGPFGSSGTLSGDLDLYEIPNVQLGQLIIADIDTPVPMGDLDSFLALYDSAGNLVVLNEDGDAAISYDSFLAVSAPADGTYYLSVAGSLFPFAAILSDPLDSSTGPGVGSEGAYDLTLRLESGDADWLTVDLDACDILGLSLSGAGDQVLVRDPGGTLVVASTLDLSSAYPMASPLPGGGRAVLGHVATTAGRYGLRVLGIDGDYTLTARVDRPTGESALDPKILFVDFDGASFDRGIFIGATPALVTLSPLSSFLANWGLAPGDEDAVIDAVLAVLHENVAVDPHAFGPNPNFGVEIRNSRDHADPFGQPGVSRLIIGGSIAELGLATIGIAQSIDVGNFETAETAVVLLDLLSRPAPAADSLNSFERADGVSMVDFVGVALGNIAAHEAGHFTGSFHTENRNPAANLMDRGGNLPNTLGLGIDGIFGTADDVDVDFGADHYVDAEGFAGLEETLTIQACGCAVAASLFADDFETGETDRWSSRMP
ncbi:MAG: PPC domain-containing protein [Acidobacteriota bacterium]